jgi:ubiquitin C-terminal hydrolase
MSTALSGNTRLQQTTSSYMMETVSSQSNRVGASQAKLENLQNLTQGIQGMKNNRFYCYLNACLQCLAPITEMRNHYLTQTYAGYTELKTLRNNFDYSNGMYLFYKAMFKK